MKKALAAFLFVFSTCCLAAQTAATVTMLTVNDGLSQGMIFDILQSRDGFLWIATKDGLNRYDGSRFKVFSPDPFNPFAIGGSAVQGLFEDSRGWIWTLLPEGLDVLDPVSGRFFHLLHEGKSFENAISFSFSETPDGVVWFSDRDRVWKASPPADMLSQAAKQGNARIELPCKPMPLPAASGPTGGQVQVRCLLFTRQQKLLAGTNQGLFRLEPATGQFVPELLTPDADIGEMAESSTGELILWGSQADVSFMKLVANGKVIYDQGKWPANNFGSLVFDDTGHFWVFNQRNGTIQKWKTAAFFNNGLPEQEIPPGVLGLEGNRGYGCTSSFVDKSGMVWVGTSGYGVVKINEKGQKFKTALAGNAHRFLFEDPGGALYSISLPDKKFLTKSFDRSVPNTDLPLGQLDGTQIMTSDPAGNIWWIDKAGNRIHCMRAGSKATTAFPFEGSALICDRNRKLVSVNEKGLHRFDPVTQTSQHFNFETPQQYVSENSFFLYEDGDGVVWIYGFAGLIRATPGPSGYRYQQYLNDPANRSSLSINHVLSVCDDPLEPGRYLWAGTKGGGLNRLDKQAGTFKKYSTAQGLPDNVVYGVLAQDRPKGSQSPGFIWLSTNKGLCRFDVRAETTKNFSVTDGLQDNEFNSAGYLKTRDGYLIFSGVNGINVFHPDSLRFNNNVPQVHIVGLQVNNQPFDFSGQSPIMLSHNQNLLNFEFAALEFTNPAQNQYRYQLNGAGNDWVWLGNKSSIQFANLPPGDYTFKVLGSNNDGAWSTQPAEMRFTILPPWYASWWSYLLYLAMAATGGWLFYRNRLRRRIEHEETLRLREMDEFKSRFFTNITHEFRTPLTVILGMSEQLAQAETDQPKQGKLGLIKRSGEGLLRLINQILDLAKLESNALNLNYIQGDVLTFLKYIAESLHSLANAQNLLLRVESEQAAIVMDYDPERLLQIVHNLLSNAIKFTPSGGRVVMRADVKDKWLHITVMDTGAGIPAGDLPHVFDRFFQANNLEKAKAGGTGIGLALTKELVHAMGGEISVESTVGKGTTFVVELPVTNQHTIEQKGANRMVQDWIPAAAVARPPTPLAPADGSGQQVLLIEDNPDVVEYLAACLQGSPDREGHPYQLEFAYNGRAGIEKALESVPDLIVSDVMMPEKNGFEVVEALKNDERTSHIPIILLTAKADVESRIKGLRRGADAYLSKPFHQEELLVTVDNLLETRKKLQAKYGNVEIGKPTALPEGKEAGGAPDVQGSDPEDSFLQKFRSVVEANLSDSDFELPQLERALAMSRSQIFRKIKALTGKPPSLYIRSIRLHHGRHLLKTTNLTVSEIAYQVGYSALNNFSDAFFEEFGERPTGARGRD